MKVSVEPLAAVQPTTEPPRVIPPAPASVFAERARRFDQLAEGHALGDWLRFLGRLTAAQHEALLALPPLPLPDPAALARAREHGMPPLPAQSLPRGDAWRNVLAAIAIALKPQAPAPARASLDALLAADTTRLEALADRVLRTELYGDDAHLLPFAAAALQVCWTRMAADLGPQRIPLLDVPGVCPCCGFLPVASLVRVDGPVANLRYLHCALCNTEWNLVRVKCAACDDNGKVSYRQIENGNGIVRAEVCDTCHSYLKIVHRDRDPAADPVADDLASLAIDMLVDEAGYARCGPNLLFVPGG